MTYPIDVYEFNNCMLETAILLCTCCVKQCTSIV